MQPFTGAWNYDEYDFLPPAVRTERALPSVLLESDELYIMHGITFQGSFCCCSHEPELLDLLREPTTGDHEWNLDHPFAR